MDQKPKKGHHKGKGHRGPHKGPKGPKAQRILIYHELIQLPEGPVIWMPMVDCPEPPDGSKPSALWLDRCFFCKRYGGETHFHYTTCLSKRPFHEKEDLDNPQEDIVAGARGGVRLSDGYVPPPNIPPKHQSDLLVMKKKKEDQNDPG